MHLILFYFIFIIRAALPVPHRNNKKLSCILEKERRKNKCCIKAKYNSANCKCKSGSLFVTHDFIFVFLKGLFTVCDTRLYFCIFEGIVHCL